MACFSENQQRAGGKGSCPWSSLPASWEFGQCSNDEGKFLQTFKQKNDIVTFMFWKITQAAVGKQIGEDKAKAKRSQKPQLCPSEIVMVPMKIKRSK